MSACFICLQPLKTAGLYHSACAKAMFGHGGQAATTTIHFDCDVRRIQMLARKPNGRPLLPGTQCKVPVCVTCDRRGVRIAIGPGAHILKPQNAGADLPQNELVTMRIAELAGVEIAPCALVPLADGTLAYLVRHVDKNQSRIGFPEINPGLVSDAGLVHEGNTVEDFCSLAGKPEEAKYDGTAELCAEIIRTHATEPVVEMAKLFRRFVVAWWTGNCDMHLRDLALIQSSDGMRRLSPAYGLQCTRLAIADDRMALPVGGKRRDFTHVDWLAFGERCGLRRPAIERILLNVAQALTPAAAIIQASPLAQSAKTRFAELLRVTCPVTSTSHTHPGDPLNEDSLRS